MINTYDLFSLKGKNVLITGGRQMYGLGATLALADAGANIYLASHSIESTPTITCASLRVCTSTRIRSL